MSIFSEIVEKSYPTFAQMEQDVEKASVIDGFKTIKKNTRPLAGGNLSGGAFRCYKSGTSTASTRGTLKTDCKFQLNFSRHRETGVYFFTKKRILTHSHTLDPNSATMTALARRFTPSQAQLIDYLHSNGLSVSRITAKLREKTNVMFQSKDVYNNLQNSERIEVDGPSQVHDLFLALDGSEDFTYKYSADENYCLSGLVFASRRALAQFSGMSFVLLMDSTYNTNRFNMPQLIISSVDQFGHSYIVACCLLRDETIPSYELALLSFKQLFGSAVPSVNVIITDQESALMNAIATHFPNSNHQLCTWHLATNVKKHIDEKSLTWWKFLRFMHSNTEQAAEQIYLDVVDHCSAKEAAYLKRVYDLKERFVEAWICRYKNLGIRSTQRAESMNRAFKRLLEANSPLVELFRVLKRMTDAYMESRAFIEFQARDRPGVYPPLISSLAGQVSSFILERLGDECSKLGHLFIGVVGDEHVSFNDSYKFSWQHGCNCPFAIQYSAPCVHKLKVEGEPSLSSFHPAWRISETPISQPAILYGPRQETQLSPEDKILAELTDISSYVQASLFNMDPSVALSFAKKFRDMIDRKDLNAPTNIRDPPISRTRGRPKKPKKNTFKGMLNF